MTFRYRKLLFPLLALVIVAAAIFIHLLFCSRQPITPNLSELDTINDDATSLFAINSIPRVYLSTQEEPTEKTEYKSLEIKIDDDKIPANNFSATGKIRPRGNSTLKIGQTYGAMPYKIKLDQATELLGMGKHKKWNLLTNFIDRSYVKQFIAFASARLMSDSSRYQPQAKFVEVFMNDEYKGLYLLTESVEEDDGALDIALDTFDSTDNLPFLIELEYSKTIQNYSDTEVIELFSSTHFFANSDLDPKLLNDASNTNFPALAMLKYPESLQDVSEEQQTELIASVRKVYSDLATRNPLSTVNIAPESFAQSIIFCYLFTNPSCYYGPSQFIYRSVESPKIYAGPLWDFDASLVPTSSDFRFLGDIDYHPLISSLLDYADFRTILKEQLEIYHEHHFSIIRAQINSLKNNELLHSAVQRSEAKYNTWGRSLEWFNSPGDYPNSEVLKLKNLDDHIDYINNYLFGSENELSGRAGFLYSDPDPWSPSKY